MKYDYFVVREQLPTGGKNVDGPLPVFSGIEAIAPTVEVLNISIVDLPGGLYAYAACRVPEQRKAGTK